MQGCGPPGTEFDTFRPLTAYPIFLSLPLLDLHFATFSGGQSTQIKYLSKSTDTYNKILLQ